VNPHCSKAKVSVIAMTPTPQRVAVPKYPLVMLTPRSSRPPTQETLALIEKTAKVHIESKELWSVTYSPLVCPEGKNWLFSLKPYYWEKNGEWGESSLSS